jgi:hypothetical protein
MNHNQPIPPETIRHLKRKNLLWLVVLPPLLSFALVSVVKPVGRFAFWIELAIICLCSFFCGFVLAIRYFKTFKKQFLGGLFFAGSSLYLISCVVFLGCLPLPQRPLSPAQIQANRHQEEIRRKAWVAKQILPRDAEADSSMLDLSLFYDGILPGTTPENNSFFRFQKSGTHTWDGIKFDARGTIGTGWLMETVSIPVGRKCSEADFLHGAYWGEPSNIVSQFIVHFANGHDETIPIIFGEDVADSQFRNNFVPTNAIVWEEKIPTNAPPQPIYGFFIKKWSNPFPNETIATVDFVPKQNSFLVAITLKPISSENK